MDDSSILLACAHSIIDSVPRLSRPMRKDLRLHSAGTFTEAQFRVMAYLFREGTQSLSDMADFMGVSLPTMSKLVQGLVSRELVSRERDPDDRRRVRVCLTDMGECEYAALLQRTEEHIVSWIRDLDKAQCTLIIQAFDLLTEAFSKVELQEPSLDGKVCHDR